MILDEGKLEKWLSHRKGLSIRSAKDVISRFKRVGTFVDCSRNHSDEELINTLNKNKNFQKLTETVRSQLRRSIRLVKAFTKK